MSEQEPSAYERGMAKITEVYAGDVVAMPEGTMPFYDVMMRSLFAEVWDRDVLPIRDRRLLLLGAIATHGQTDTFVIQARAALKRGELTAEELRECLIMLAPYAGYPNVAGLIAPVETVIGETLGDDGGAAPALTSEQLRATCETYVSLVGDDDVESLVALFADDCTVEDPVGADRHIGRDAVRAFFATLPPMGVSAELVGPVHAVPDAGTAAFPFVVRTGEMEMHVIDVMTFDRDGRITSMTAYWQM